MKRKGLKTLLLGVGALAALLTVSCGAKSSSESYSKGLNIEDSENGYVIAGYYDCKDKDVVIPGKYNGKTVVLIDEYSFAGCGITSVVIQDGITEIGYDAFGGCPDLKTVTIPKSVKKICGSAFYGCSGLTTIIYAGTKEEWDSIEKGASWNKNTGSYVVKCSD